MKVVSQIKFVSRVVGSVIFLSIERSFVIDRFSPIYLHRVINFFIWTLNEDDELVNFHWDI